VADCKFKISSSRNDLKSGEQATISMDPKLAAPCSVDIYLNGTLIGRIGSKEAAPPLQTVGDFQISGIAGDGSVTITAQKDQPRGTFSYKQTCPPPAPCGPTQANFKFGGPPPLPAGAPAAAVQPCKWKLHIKVHSQERFWPKDAFDVVFGAVKAPDPATPLIPPISPAWYKNNITMKAVDSSEVIFEDSGLKSGGVTAMVHTLKKQADWVLVDAAKSKTELAKQYVPENINNGQEHKIDLFIRHPLKAYLEFKFLGPEGGKIFTFPKDFPIQVWQDKQVLEEKTDEKGRIAVEIDRKHDWVTLKFGNGPVFISVGDGKAGKSELKAEADRKGMSAKGDSFFGPPDSWGLIESVWKFSEEPTFIDSDKAYKEAEGKIYVYDAKANNWVRRIGEKDAPITLTLDPSWQFNRFEYFDRYYGHTDHGHERVNMPAALIEGIWNSGKKEVREGSGQWVLNPTSVKDAVHAVPWIRQKTEDGKKSEKPDKDCYLRFKTDAETFSISSDKDTRKLDVAAAGDKRLVPGVDRLKLYDLPPQWESRGYWTRMGKAAKQKGDFWKDWAAADLLKSRDAKSPLIFSLDDIILTDTAFNPVKLAKTDQFAIFYHRFKPEYDEKANVSDHGVYKPDKNQPYYSDIKLKGDNFNYVSEYPNWVRLLAGIACLYDAFDKRTVSGVLGARAGVKWYDPVVSGQPAGKAVGFQAIVDKKHFIFEPYYGQKLAEHYLPYKVPPSAGIRGGRFDMALIRECDQLGAKEFFVSMQYYRLMFNFQPTSGTKGAAAQTAFSNNAAISVMNRWNGNDAANASRAELIPQDNTKNYTGEVLWFIQPAAAAADAHFNVGVDNPANVSRAAMDDSDGTGNINDSDGAPTKAYGTKLAYVFAHEMGHAGSLPDEYAERVNWGSHRQPGVSCNTPGDPFIDEGMYPDLTATLYPGAGDDRYPMMTQTVEMRNRYFWHNAEFARKFIGEPLFVKHGKYPDYKLPGHPNYPRYTYVYWPVNAAMSQALGKTGQADIYLSASGKDAYTVTLMPKGVYDGFLTLLLKLGLYEATGKDDPFRNNIRNTISAYNQKYIGVGDIDVPTDGGKKKTVTFDRAMFRISPRFAIQGDDGSLGANYAKRFKAALATFGVHFSINVIDAKAGVQGLNAKTGKYDMVIDYKSATFANDIANWTEQYFREMIGVAFDPKNPNKIAAADLKGVAQAVFTKNSNVKDR
jgi:hypothetical protein